MKKAFMIATLLLCSLMTPAQRTIGLPNILNYTHGRMSAGAQTWQIAQDKSGIMYFANNSGLLSFNNKEWRLYQLPNKTIARSLYIDKDDRIYVGGQGIIGYFFPDRHGVLQFHSLNEKIPVRHRLFDDIWYIVSYRNEIFFQSSGKVFKFDPLRQKMDVYAEPNGVRWSFMGVSQNSLFAHNNANYFVKFINNSWQSASAPKLNHTLITSVVDFGEDSTIVTTLRHGVFLLTPTGVLKMNLPSEVTASQIYRAFKVNNKIFALGTVSNGIYLLNNKAEIIMHFSTDNGMQNNNVLSLFVDDHLNLWAGLDEGIDLIDFSSPIHKISPTAKPAPAYTTNVFQNRLYIGTSDGLYSSPLKGLSGGDMSFFQGKFERVENSDRQVWNLCNIDGKLLMSHHDGAFVVEKEKARLVDNSSGGNWLFRSVKGGQSIVAGNYQGLQLFQNNKVDLVPVHKLVSNLKEPMRFVELDFAHHIIWTSHPYRGIYRIDVTPRFDSIKQITLLTKADGLPGNTNNFVFKIRDQILVTTERGVYEYDYTHARFMISKKYRPVFGDISIKFMTEDEKKRIWFATETGMGVVEKDSLKYIPELDGQLIAGFENIYPFNDKNIFIGSYNGIMHLNYDLYQKSTSNIRLMLSKVVATGESDSLLFDGYFVENEKLLPAQTSGLVFKLNPLFSSFHFEFSSNQYGKEDKMLYSYQLDGFDEKWSDWSHKNEKDYTNLSYGNYTFKVKAKDNLGNISPPVFYSFIILPKWYQTKLAYVGYIMLLGAMFFSANKVHRNRLRRQKSQHEKEQSHLKYVHDLELQRNEKEIFRLKNEKLETEVLYKNKELATTTMHLYKRGRLIGKIKEDLSEGMANLKNKDDTVAFRQLLKLLAEEEKQDQDWAQFSIHFDQIHNNFLKNIKHAYPELTPGDLKICAYLKMNLSSKEIAQLLNISLKGVEIGRYRLRKKLGLHQDENLISIINEFA
jgi:ligand-binding sensor domain-containing protein/DNA-binding CsgD family transcriptional regulator